MNSWQESGVRPEERTENDDDKMSLENLNLDELKTLVSMW